MIEATELEYWSSLGNQGRVSACLEAKRGDVNTRGEGGYTAMHAAAEHGHLDVLKLLLEHGGELSPRTDDGITPLELGVGHPAIVSYLRSLGAE
jgi:uncharacterized protein